MNVKQRLTRYRKLLNSQIPPVHHCNKSACVSWWMTHRYMWERNKCTDLISVLEEHQKDQLFCCLEVTWSNSLYLYNLYDHKALWKYTCSECFEMMHKWCLHKFTIWSFDIYNYKIPYWIQLVKCLCGYCVWPIYNLHAHVLATETYSYSFRLTWKTLII